MDDADRMWIRWMCDADVDADADTIGAEGAILRGVVALVCRGGGGA